MLEISQARKEAVARLEKLPEKLDLEDAHQTLANTLSQKISPFWHNVTRLILADPVSPSELKVDDHQIEINLN
jgi:hypothetical protein